MRKRIIMWYVIQTKSGEENKLKELIDVLMPRELYNECFVALYEDVWRKGGVGHISIKRLFPGYLFIDTSSPDSVYDVIKSIPRFTRLLGTPEKDGSKSFIKVTEEEMEFLSTLLKNSVMHVSYIRMHKNSNKIESISGPLAVHASRIARLDIPHRRAIVETELFGQPRRIKFGLWTDMDPVIPRFVDEEDTDLSYMSRTDIDIGIRPGDMVADASGVYGDMVMEVVSVNPIQRTADAKIKLFGQEVNIRLNADDLEVVK